MGDLVFKSTTTEPKDTSNHRSCPVCRNASVRPSLFGGYHYLQKRYAIVRCQHCGFFFVDPLPEQDLLMAVYRSSEYFDEYIAPGSDAVSYLESLHAPNEYDEMALASLSRYCHGGRLLDVGCAGGRFLARAREAGYEGCGLEPNAAMAAHARDALGLKVLEGTLQDARKLFGHSYFEVIHLGDVLEHLWDLHGAFEVIGDLLRDGGLLLLQQPMTYHRTLFNLFLSVNMSLRRDRYSGYPPLHLWEFTPFTLRRLLRENGYEVLCLKTFESKPRPFSHSRSSLKQRVGLSVKRVSCLISNARIGSLLELGDRALVVARKQ